MMDLFHSHAWDLLTVFGYTLEIWGVTTMANRFLGVDFISRILGMYSAIFRTKLSKVIADIAFDDEENLQRTFRGLSLLVWGFTLQFVAFVAEEFLTTQLD